MLFQFQIRCSSPAFLLRITPYPHHTFSGKQILYWCLSDDKVLLDILIVLLEFTNYFAAVLLATFTVKENFLNGLNKVITVCRFTFKIYQEDAIVVDSRCFMALVDFGLEFLAGIFGMLFLTACLGKISGFDIAFEILETN